MKNMMKIISEILLQETSNSLGLVKLSILIFNRKHLFFQEFDQNECSYLEKRLNKADHYTSVMKLTLDSMKMRLTVLKKGKMTDVLFFTFNFFSGLRISDFSELSGGHAHISHNPLHCVTYTAQKIIHNVFIMHNISNIMCEIHNPKHWYIRRCKHNMNTVACEDKSVISDFSFDYFKFNFPFILNHAQ